MHRIVRALFAAASFTALCASAQTAPEVTLTRLDCGAGFNDPSATSMRTTPDSFRRSPVQRC